jgi:non-specific serine/threonine protein kinase/serine/threonine-protein kinase
MTSNRWLRVKQLFDETARLTEPEREAVLAEACAGDDALRGEVKSLVDSYLQSGGFLEKPAPAFRTAAFGHLEGSRIGPYEIGPRIGAGGMGEVYRARDTRLNRTVAIKVRAGQAAQAGGGSEQFAREAQAISALNHPRICLLHDVGQHGSIDFLVMEYVEGEAIDAYCNRHRLAVRPRLAMFRTVCDAVQYAHQNLVVHRDLKPANILVAEDGEPKLLDFGIAKLLAEADGVESPVATLTPALTPDYASPEQVRGETVTTATDVYSLGVVLYELLAGCRPWSLRTASLEDIVRRVCETQPPPPSAASAGSGPGRSVPVRPSDLRGDLDTIVLKALRKEPDRRYRSPQELSDDIGRYLEGRPVIARGDSVTYRLSKFVTRHRAAAMAAALVLASLLAAMGLIVRQSRIAEAQRHRAERRFADVRKLAGSFLFEFHDAIQYLPGSTRARQLVVTRALEYLDSLATESDDDPALRAELARAYHRIGEVLGNAREANLGDASGALGSYRKALALQESLVAAEPGNRAVLPDLVRTLRGIGDVQLMMRDVPAALATFGRAITVAEQLAADGGDRGAARELATLHTRVAEALNQLGDRPRGWASLQQAIAILKLLAQDVADVDSRRALARSYKAAGALRASAGDLTRSLALVGEALRLNQALAARDPLNMTIRNEVAMSHFELGLAYLRASNPAAALASLRRAEAITASMAREDASNAQARWLHGLELNSIGVTLREMRRYPEAIASHLKALSLLEAVARADAANESYQYNVANTAQLVADAHVAVARASTSERARLQAWVDARSWYQRSARGFDGMRRRGALSGAVAGDIDAERVAAGLALCDRELRPVSRASLPLQ